jgi:hypothetical protein
VGGTWLVPGSAPQLLRDASSRLLRPDEQVFEAMLAGWQDQHPAAPRPASTDSSRCGSAEPADCSSSRLPMGVPGHPARPAPESPARASGSPGDWCSGTVQPHSHLAPARQRRATRRSSGRHTRDSDATRHLGRRRLPRLRSYTDVDTQPRAAVIRIAAGGRVRHMRSCDGLPASGHPQWRALPAD